MSNYLAYLIGRSLGQGEFLSPRPKGLFEPPPSTDNLIPSCHSHPETLEEEDTHNEAMSDSQSSVPPLTNPKDASRRSLTGAQVPDNLEAPYHQMDDLHKSPHQFLGQSTNLQVPLSKPHAPQSPESNSERGPSQPDQSLAKPEVPTITPRQKNTTLEHRVPQPETKTTEMKPTQTAIHTVPQESGPDQHVPPPSVARSAVDAIPIQSPGTQQNQAKISSTRRPDMGGRIDTSRASLSPIIRFSEPQVIHSETIKPALTQIDVRPYTELINGASLEPVINVTIGRIEVKATKPREPEQPRQKKKPSGVMSLDKYLSQSERGGVTHEQ